jgi:hypothetical protein
MGFGRVDREKTTIVEKRKGINLRLSASNWQREWVIPFLATKIQKTLLESTKDNFSFILRKINSNIF